MSSPTNDLAVTATWFHDQLDRHLVTRLSRAQLLAIKNLPAELYNRLTTGIQSSINAFNYFPANVTNPELDHSLFINALYLKSIYERKLSTYHSILEQIKQNASLQALVFGELRDSTYFQDIYKIDNATHLLTNLMILLYRNALLSLHPELRTQKAQTPSTLEEMACLLHLQGETNLVFEGTKHWILDWEGEGFSEVLAKMIQS